MNLLIATCDDEICYCKQVEDYMIKLGNSLGIRIDCDKYQSGTELLENNFHQYRIIFLDIDMKDENGIDIAERIRRENESVSIVFLTAFLQYALEGYKVNAYRFLVKPVEYDDFVFQLQDLLVRLDSMEKSSLIVTKEGQDYALKVEDIVYIEVMNHSVTYHCVDYDFTASGTMRKIENNLKGQYFVRIHNSYIVNMRYIAEVRNQQLILKNGTELLVARGKKEAFKQAYLEFWGDELG